MAQRRNFSWESLDAHACLIVQWFWLFATSWTIAHQAPLSMGFSRQKYWSGLPFPSPLDLPIPGTELASLVFKLHCRQILYALSHWENLKSLDVRYVNAQAQIREVIRNTGLVLTPRSYTNHLCLADDFKGNTVCVLGSTLLSLFLWWRSQSLRALPEALEWSCYHCGVRGPRGSRAVPSVFFRLASRVIFLSSLLKRLKNWRGVENFLKWKRGKYSLGF